MVQSLKFKKGAASFYIVAFSTLILLIIATSFAAVIISEVTRTSNADLAQSAYDSALAGVEDAKLAFYNYQACVTKGATAVEPKDDSLTCGNIIWYVENDDCDMVAHILGRLKYGEAGEVPIEESSSGSNNMMQAYTCNKINTTLADYSSTLSSSQPIKVIKPSFEEGNSANDITQIRINWFSDEDKKGPYSYGNLIDNNVVFPGPTNIKPATPPTISIAMLQTAGTFSLSSFDVTAGGQTNRGMLYLVPTDKTTAASISVADNRKAGYIADKGINHIGTEGFLSSNDKKGGIDKNLPYAVYCPDNTGNNYACSVTIDLPDPIDGKPRNDDTFAFIVSFPYGNPTSHFSLEFCNGTCPDEAEPDAAGGESDTPEGKRINLQGVQIGVDSTGRANNLYRRVQARLESGANDFPLSIMGPLELLGKDDVLNKNFFVTTEYNFSN